MEYFEENFSFDVRKKMFKLLVVTGSIANLCGFVSNIFLYGMTGPSAVCGLCFLAIVLLGIIGNNGGRAELSGAGIILVISWFEFPLLLCIWKHDPAVFCDGDGSGSSLSATEAPVVLLCSDASA